MTSGPSVQIPPAGVVPLRELLRGMWRVRAFEERVGELFARAALPRHSHLSIGEEAVAVGTRSALRRDDFVTSTHRGHGHLIAKGASMVRPSAEQLISTVRAMLGGPAQPRASWPTIRGPQADRGFLGGDSITQIRKPGPDHWSGLAPALRVFDGMLSLEVLDRRDPEGAILASQAFLERLLGGR